MLSLKTWTAHHGNKTIIVTAECVEVARQLVADRHGIELANVDLVPAVTRSRWSRVIESDKAAIVAELERQKSLVEKLVDESRDPLSRRLAAGMSLGLARAIDVVETGGALLPETQEEKD
jgi:hypothetical protein